VFVARSDGFEGLFRLNALKRLKPELCADIGIVSRFIEEARLAVRVEHIGTVGVDDFGRVGGVYFIAYEMLDGVNLTHLMRSLASRRVPLDPRAAAFIIQGAALALDHVHRQRGADGASLGLAHGALEPRSVWVTRSGRVKLRGFVAPSVFPSASQREEVLGLTGLAALAPEQHQGALPSIAGDVWGLGTLL
jgi:serine/threonine-protein kinase